MNDYIFGNFICQLRTEKKLTQSELGKILGVSNKAVSKWENGASKPTTGLLSKLSQILDVSVEELLMGARIENNEKKHDLKEKIIKASRSLAIKASVAFSAVFTVFLLILDAIIIINGFALPDDIAGPLSAMLSIILLVSSVTCTIVFNIEFKKTNYYPDELLSDKDYSRIKKTICIPLIVILFMTLTAFPFYYFMLLLIPDAGVVLDMILLYWVIFLTVIILCVSILIFGLRMKSILNLSYIRLNAPSAMRERIRFSSLPLYAKICYIGVIVLIPLMLYSGIWFILMPWRIIYLCISFTECVMLLIVSITKYRLIKCAKNNKESHDNHFSA